MSPRAASRAPGSRTATGELAAARPGRRAGALHPPAPAGAAAAGRATRTAASAWARAAVLAAASTLAACVTTYETGPLADDPDAARERLRLERPELAIPVAIPIPATSPQTTLADEFFRSVLLRMHGAAKDRDVEDLESLLAQYEGRALPGPVREQMTGFRAVARGLRFTRAAARRAEIVVVLPPADAAAAPPIEAGAPALGAPLQLEMRLGAVDEPVVLGGRDDADPIGFLVSITVDDAAVDGSTSTQIKHSTVWQPLATDLRGDTVLCLPIDVSIAGGTAIRRRIEVRVDLMPGYAQFDGGRAPVPQTELASRVVHQWPVGYEALAKAPLTELQNALRAFEPRSFARAYLAATATTGEERAAAIDLLLEQVRFGRPAQAQVAMAALHHVTGAAILVGDRDAWLAWARDRR